MNRNWKIALALAAAIIIPGGTYAAIAAYWLGKICYNIYGFRILSADSKYVSIELTLEVKNPSSINITIEGYDLGVSLNNFKVAQIESKDLKVLSAGAVSYLNIPIKINHQEVFGAVKSGEFITNVLLKNFDKINVALGGKFLGEILKIPVSTKIKMNYTVAEILKMRENESAPCVTGKVKKEKPIKLKI